MPPPTAHFAVGIGTIRTSLRACGAWLVLLGVLTLAIGPGALLRHYVGPYLVFVVWLDLVTYLHHAGPDVTWFRGAAWTPLGGALSSIDRTYGVFDRVHHHAGWHTAHHLFPGAPHYRLRQATEALRPLLGERYRCDPVPVTRALAWAWAHPSVPESGERVTLSRRPRAAADPARTPRDRPGSGCCAGSAASRAGRA